MRKMFFVMTIFSTFYICSNLEAQDFTPADPLSPKDSIKKFYIGTFGGIIYPLIPKELTKTPTTATSETQKSLLNGLNMLGFEIRYGTVQRGCPEKALNGLQNCRGNTNGGTTSIENIWFGIPSFPK